MPTHWDKLKVVDHMQGVIEEHLHEPLTLAVLTRGTGYSLYHASRIFKEVTGKTCFEYLRARRLSAAAERLAAQETRVVDVAFDFVFDSHEGFTRAFSRTFGLSPTSHARSKAKLPLFPAGSARDYYRKRQTGDTKMNENTNKTVRTVFVQIVERPARKLVLKRGKKAEHYFAYCEEEGCDIYEKLAKIPDALHEPMGLWLPDGMRPEGTSTYVQGVEVPTDWKGIVPEGFETMGLPSCKLLVFQGEPFEEKQFEDAIHELWDIMKGYRPESIGYRWADEDAARFQLEPQGARGYIEGRPVRPV